MCTAFSGSTGYKKMAGTKKNQRNKPFQTFSLRHLDVTLIALIVILNCIGIAAIGSAEPSLQTRQAQGMLAGIVLMLFLSAVDYRRIVRFGWLWYIAAIVGLSLVFTPLGVARDSAYRWINVGMQLQPSELAKILLILFYAKFIMTYKSRVRQYVWVILGFAFAVPPLLLIYEEPDLSTMIMVFVIIAAILFVSGLSMKFVAAVFAIAVPALIIVVTMVEQGTADFLTTYQQNRILAWLHPEDYSTTTAYQTMNSIMAIGSGQLTGKGYNTNEISSLLNSGYISESQTDFIFTVIGEEFGFIGSVAVVILLALIAIRCYLIARTAKDEAGTIIAVGMGTWIGFQGFLNIAVATGVFPNTGIPLPFVSYGLTSLLSLYMGVGFVLNVRMQTFRKPQAEGMLRFYQDQDSDRQQLGAAVRPLL